MLYRLTMAIILIILHLTRMNAPGEAMDILKSLWQVILASILAPLRIKAVICLQQSLLPASIAIRRQWQVTHNNLLAIRTIYIIRRSTAAPHIHIPLKTTMLQSPLDPMYLTTTNSRKIMLVTNIVKRPWQLPIIRKVIV